MDAARNQDYALPRCSANLASAAKIGNAHRSSFGARAQAIIGYLTGRLALSHRDAAEAMRALHGLEVSVGSIASLQRQVSEALAASVVRAQAFVQYRKSQHVDETGWREGVQRKWLWVNVISDVTVFTLLDGRSTRAAKQVIKSSAKSIITTDRYGVYNWLAPRRRQICWAHLQRDF
ncbi:MAG: transposase [Pyrinomonadaceae bacterium]|nr:transposase [Pyrinomonadaceae bacterium]